eukprot:RCo037353
MLENEQNAESARYPGVFVTRKKKTAKSETLSTPTIPPRFDNDDIPEYDWEKAAVAAAAVGQAFGAQHEYNDSPASEPISEQCISTQSENSCSNQRFHQLPRDFARGYDEKNGKQAKRKKNKDKKMEINSAVDAIRYKTKMCKNWQLHEKCPYGPRCLFAHGTKELRTYAVNHSAIATAANSESPERQFYALGHFPSFIPVPFLSTCYSSATLSDDADASDGLTSEPTNGEKSRDNTPCPSLPIDCGASVVAANNNNPKPQLQVTTHSPYTAPPSPPPRLLP